MDTLKYKGFIGSIEAELDDDTLYGKVLGLDKGTLVTYEGKTLAEDIVVNGKVLACAGEVVDRETAIKAQNAGVNRVAVSGKNGTFYIIFSPYGDKYI